MFKEGIAGKVVNWLVRNEAVEESERELYEYAVQSLSMLIAPLFMAAGIGWLFGEFKMSFVLILPFMVLRKYSGGYHAKKQRICMIISSLLLALCFASAKFLTVGPALTIGVICAAICLAIFSPVDSENRRLSKEEQRDFGKVARILVTIFVTLYMALILLKKDTSAVYLALGIILPAVLQLPCILKKERKLNKE